MELKIETTADGSPTLYREDIDEHYHSVKGAVAESRHIYLELGWKKAAGLFKCPRVLEAGFGAGLNAAVTAYEAEAAGIATDYYSVELYPVDKALSDLFIPLLPEAYREVFKAVNDAEWGLPVRINEFFCLTKAKADLLTTELPADRNIVYFDAFAPEKQPEIWDESVVRRVYDCLVPEGILTTYCAKGAIRRMFSQMGFEVERLPGPPGGKREVLRAVKLPQV